MVKDDISYLRQRATTELEMAQNAVLPEAGSVHCRLAGAYLERIAIIESTQASEQTAALGQSAVLKA